MSTSNQNTNNENKTAVLIFHGMGQQVPFETLGMVASKVIDKSKEGSQHATISQVKHLGEMKSEKTSICKVSANIRGKDVDFYESYWAPITEGKVSLYDAVFFLLKGGWAGLIFDFWGLFKIKKGKKFTRFFWKGEVEYSIPCWHNFMLLALPIAVIVGLASIVIALLRGIKTSHWLEALDVFSFMFRILHFLLLPALGALLILSYKGKEEPSPSKFFKKLRHAIKKNWMVILAIIAGVVQIPPLFERLRCIKESLSETDKLTWLGYGPDFLSRFYFWMTEKIGLIFGIDQLKWFRCAFEFIVRVYNWMTNGISSHLDWLRTFFSFNDNGLGNGILNWAIYIDFVVVIFAVIVGFMAHRFKVFANKYPRKKIRTIILWYQSLAAMGAIFIGGIWSMGWHIYSTIHDIKLSGTFNSYFLLLCYGGLGLVVILFLNYFLIEYAGDVAAYLSAHTASKFAEVRAKIQAEAFETACHVYASKYQNVIIVGHSLGSVVAYDTLNGILNYAALHGKKDEWDPVNKTGLLLTFGSPLDKTAFIFRLGIKDRSKIREALASSKQPLLEEEGHYRPKHWVNVWSPNDIISGRLEFYDAGSLEPKDTNADPFSKEFNFTYRKVTQDSIKSRAEIDGLDLNMRKKFGPVISIIDPDADIPYAAHNQYWKNGLIYEIILNAIEDKKEIKVDIKEAISKS